MKKFLCLFFIFILAFVFVGCKKTPTEETKNPTQGNEPTKEPTKTIDPTVEKSPELVLDLSSLELVVGESYDIPYEVKNLEGSNLVNITSSNDNVVSVTGDKLNAVSVGAAKVTVALASDPSKSVSFNVLVKDAPVIQITGVGSLEVGGTLALSAEALNITGNIEWASSDENIATVNEDGIVTGVAKGNVTITASIGEVKGTVELTVSNLSIKFNNETLVYVGETLELKPVLEGYDGEFTFDCTEQCEEPPFSVSADGVVTGLKEGVASIICTAGEVTGIIEITVWETPGLEVTGPTWVYTGHQIQLEANLIHIEGEVSWRSNYEKACTVDENGLVTCVGSGNATIIVTVTYNDEEYTVRYKLDCIKEPDRVEFDFDGGVSEEVYMAQEKKEVIPLNAYANNGGTYWTNYPTTVFIYEETNRTDATFSDRIFIGINPDSGYYEVKGVVTSGSSTWPAGAKFVITYSTSYSNYRSLHAKTTTLNIGDIVFLTGDPTKLNDFVDYEAYFFDKVPTNYKINVEKEDFKGLPQPTKLGYEFLGWFNTKTKKFVQELTEVTGIVPLVARWNELNPVTDITFENAPEELIVGKTQQITATVVPADAYFKQVIFRSSNEDILKISDSGLITAVNAGVAKVIVTDYVGKLTKEIEINVYANPQISVSFDKEFHGTLEVDEAITFIPKYYGKDNGEVSYTFVSSDTQILSVDNNGLVTGLQKGSANITVTGKCANSTDTFELVYSIIVEDFNNPSTKIDEVIALIAENNFSVVAMGNACLYNDGTNRYYKATYGSVNNYLFDDLVIDRSNAPIAAANANGHKDRTAVGNGDILFVTVHDTATLTSSAQSTASSMATGETSIHYTTGNGVVCQCVPEEYIAYHAGDGTGTTFRWYATGVKVTTPVDPFDWSTYPEFDITGSGSTWYFTINGQKTNVQAPISNGSKTISNPSKENLPDLGPVWMIQNGEYYLGTTWVDFSQMAIGCIGSHGGNNNSIGIEMGVGTGSNMYDTWKRTAKLVADILIRNDLDITRVKQHNTWTGKNCPQCIRAGGNWWEFMDMVSIEYQIMKKYPGITIKLETDSNIIDSTGMVVNAPKVTTVVNYKVTVSDGSTSKSINLSSIVPGTNTWTRLTGTYKSSVIWNGGVFDLNLNKEN